MQDLGAWKPLIGALLLPPVPWLVLVLVGARLILPRRNLGFFILLLGVVGLWMGSCSGTALWLQDQVLRPPPALLGETQDRLTAEGRAYAQRVALATRQGRTPPSPSVGIMVLGAGLVPRAPEYGVADLPHYFAERLRYGVWLGRQTGWPVGASGGVGWAQKEVQIGPAEAEVAGRVAQLAYGVPLRWIEKSSVDTRGNAAASVAMLADQGVTEIVLVTDAFHMPRARRAFEQAAAAWAARAGKPVPTITPAPMKFWGKDANPVLAWMPSGAGMANVRMACHEWLGLLAGS
ncbi:YdcF family protein [Aquabacterium sp.]|uniref:YdcF family protein n=1 Tax=Aquabacterium sp. TaxID=1872578 RepID=UPI003D6D96FE